MTVQKTPRVVSACWAKFCGFKDCKTLNLWRYIQKHKALAGLSLQAPWLEGPMECGQLQVRLGAEVIRHKEVFTTFFMEMPLLARLINMLGWRNPGSFQNYFPQIWSFHLLLPTTILWFFLPNCPLICKYMVNDTGSNTDKPPFHMGVGHHTISLPWPHGTIGPSAQSMHRTYAVG